jgi:hypothetical protein
MTVVTVTCEWCGQTCTKNATKGQPPPRFCGRSCSAKWRMSRPEYVASLDTPKRRAAASQNLRRWRDSPYGQARLQAHLTGPNNPIRNPEVLAKSQEALRTLGYPTLTGGNGHGPTMPQQMLATRLGWPMEFVVRTGRAKP